MRQCSRELAPLAQLVGCLATGTFPAPVHHLRGLLHKPNQDWVSSCELLSKASDEASHVTSTFASFTALSANPLLCESYSALSSILTFTPASFNAVAADSFRTKIDGSLSDLTRTYLCEATTNHIVLEFSNGILVCTFRWHNGCANVAITVTLDHQIRGSRRPLQQVVTFVQVTVANGNRWNRGFSSTGTMLMHSATSDATLATPGSEHCMPTGRVLFLVCCCWSCRHHKLCHRFTLLDIFGNCLNTAA